MSHDLHVSDEGKHLTVDSLDGEMVNFINASKVKVRPSIDLYIIVLVYTYLYIIVLTYYISYSISIYLPVYYSIDLYISYSISTYLYIIIIHLYISTFRYIGIMPFFQLLGLFHKRSCDSSPGSYALYCQ